MIVIARGAQGTNFIVRTVLQSTCYLIESGPENVLNFEVNGFCIRSERTKMVMSDYRLVPFGKRWKVTVGSFEELFAQQTARQLVYSEA